MGWLSSLISVGGAILGNKMSQSGARKQNEANAIEAAKQRAWQERMSNTAHQREAKDLELAGLNRILSVQRSGASTPSGAQATHVNEKQAAAQNTMSLAMQLAQKNNIEANTAKTQAETSILTPKATVYEEIGNIVKDGISGIKALGQPPKTKGKGKNDSKTKSNNPKDTKGKIKEISNYLGISEKETKAIIVAKFRDFKGTPKELEQALIDFLVNYKKEPSINIKE